MENSIEFLKKLNIELSCDSAILLLDLLPKKDYNSNSKRHPNVHGTPLFMAALLFTIGKTWKQPTCPSTDEWIKMWHIYTTEYYLAIKRMK